MSALKATSTTTGMTRNQARWFCHFCIARPLADQSTVGIEAGHRRVEFQNAALRKNRLLRRDHDFDLVLAEPAGCNIAGAQMLDVANLNGEAAPAAAKTDCFRPYPNLQPRGLRRLGQQRGRQRDKL